jgi:hypothetical protein
LQALSFFTRIIVLSFMGDKEARLLQAYFGEKGLGVHKSRLLSFENPEAAEKSIEVSATIHGG